MLVQRGKNPCLRFHVQYLHYTWKAAFWHTTSFRAATYPAQCKHILYFSTLIRRSKQICRPGDIKTDGARTTQSRSRSPRHSRKATYSRRSKWCEIPLPFGHPCRSDIWNLWTRGRDRADNAFEAWSRPAGPSPAGCCAPECRALPMAVIGI